MSAPGGRTTRRSPARKPSSSPGRSSGELWTLLLAAGADTPEPERILTAAWDREDAAARAAGDAPTVSASAAGAALARFALASPLAQSAVDDVVAALARMRNRSPGATRVDLFVDALAELGQADVVPRLALDAQLRLLAVLAPVASVSLWVQPEETAAAAAGDVSPPPPVADGVVVVAVDDGTRVLAAMPRSPADRATCAAYLDLAAPATRMLVRRELRVEQETAGDASAAAASERRLIRLGFDLHDGALQNVVALAADLRLFRTQLTTVLGDEHTEIVLGRIDDLEARLLELERELRELAQSLQPQSLVARPLPEAVRAEVEAAGARWAVATTLTLEGVFEGVTASQRLALLRVLQEALTNAREHGRATHVDVALSESDDGLRLEVTDNGRGFAVEEALERAARRGSLGLAGMRERVAHLGGSFSIESRRGGPTTVSARVPRWTPISPEP